MTHGLCGGGLGSLGQSSKDDAKGGVRNLAYSSLELQKERNEEVGGKTIYKT